MLLLDQGHLTTAIPGAGGERRQGCDGADAATPNRCSSRRARPRLEKGNRDEVEGKQFIGNYDEFTADGGLGAVFRPLWWRT